MIRVAALASALFLFATAAQAAPDFSYDASKPLNAVYGKPVTLALDVTSRSISFASPTGHTVTGEVISGASKTPRPAILFVHWLGDPKTTNHTEFEPDAIALAKHGATALLIDAMWSGGEDWFNTMGSDAQKDYDVSAAQVIDTRRSLDVLMSQPNVDPARVAYVAHDFGAMFGALVAGVDTRPQYYVFMAGTATMTEWYLLEHKAKDEAAYRAVIDPLDIQGSLKASKAKAYLLQYSAKDGYISNARARLFIDATPLPKGAFWYDTDHTLAVPEAFADRNSWLTEKLFGK